MTASRDAGTRTAFLGRFDPLELPVILDVLRERGIFALTKASLDEAENEQYPFFGEGRQVLLVDGARLEEARRLIEREVPARLAEQRAELGEGGDADAVPEGLAPLGWLEPEAARALLEVLADAGIAAATEYPLDRPAPPYARADGRVRVHVEEPFLGDAAELLETEVPEILAARGVAHRPPLLGTDEP